MIALVLDTDATATLGTRPGWIGRLLGRGDTHVILVRVVDGSAVRWVDALTRRPVDRRTADLIAMAELQRARCAARARLRGQP